MCSSDLAALRAGALSGPVTTATSLDRVLGAAFGAVCDAGFATAVVRGSVAAILRFSALALGVAPWVLGAPDVLGLRAISVRPFIKEPAQSGWPRLGESSEPYRKCIFSANREYDAQHVDIPRRSVACGPADPRPGPRTGHTRPRFGWIRRGLSTHPRKKHSAARVARR